MMQVVTTRRKKHWTIMQNTWTISFYNKTAKIQQQKKAAPVVKYHPNHQEHSPYSPPKKEKENEKAKCFYPALQQLT